MTAEELLPIFREQFPEYSALSDDYVLGYLNKALLIHAICPMATVYLSAHLIAIDQDSGIGSVDGPKFPVDSGGAAREVVSERGKNINTTFKSMAKKESDTFYTATPYGRMYITLRDACPGQGFSVRVF